MWLLGYLPSPWWVQEMVKEWRERRLGFILHILCPWHVEPVTVCIFSAHETCSGVPLLPSSSAKASLPPPSSRFLATHPGEGCKRVKTSSTMKQDPESPSFLMSETCLRSANAFPSDRSAGRPFVWHVWVYLHVVEYLLVPDASSFPPHDLWAGEL